MNFFYLLLLLHVSVVVHRQSSESRVDGQDVRPEHVGAMINKNFMQQVPGRPRRRWEDNIKMDIQELVCGGVWIGSSWLGIGTDGGHL